jgi:hypothetical protein
MNIPQWSKGAHQGAYNHYFTKRNLNAATSLNHVPHINTIVVESYNESCRFVVLGLEGRLANEF